VRQARHAYPSRDRRPRPGPRPAGPLPAAGQGHASRLTAWAVGGWTAGFPGLTPGPVSSRAGECGPSGASDRWQAADFEQLDPERLHRREHAIQRGSVGEQPGQHGVAAAGLGLQVRERGANCLAQAAADADAVPVGRPLGVGTGHILTTHAVSGLLAVREWYGPARVTPPA